MMTMSKPLSAGQAQRYHAEQFRDAGENYYTEGHEIRGQWDGRLAAAWGLAGEVSEEHFARLAEGQHPLTGELLVKAQTPQLQTNARGETVRAVEHRAAWDLTFSAPKSVSVTALVGGDEPKCRQHTGELGNEDGSDPQLVGQLACMQRTGAPEGDECEVGGIVSAFDRYDA